jgi:hypothetical protein
MRDACVDLGTGVRMRWRAKRSHDTARAWCSRRGAGKRRRCCGWGAPRTLGLHVMCVCPCTCMHHQHTARPERCCAGRGIVGSTAKRVSALKRASDCSTITSAAGSVPEGLSAHYCSIRVPWALPGPLLPLQAIRPRPPCSLFTLFTLTLGWPPAKRTSSDVACVCHCTAPYACR